MSSVSIVIPTLNAGPTIGRLVDSLAAQTLVPDKIVVIDSSSDDETVQIAGNHGASVLTISRNEFDHGATRHEAFMSTSSTYVLFMTQDAKPVNQSYIENLTQPFCDPAVAMVSGRQIPRSNARKFEKLVRQYNYPNHSFTRDVSDIKQLGIKTFFVSDVCSAYRREAYLSCGGFARPCNTNEDMLMAAKFLRNGYKIAYAGNAAVIHSHNLSLGEEYSRNKAIGVFLASHRDELYGASAVGEGGKMVFRVMKQLLAQKDFSELSAFVADCAARYLGNRMGGIEANRKTIGY
ncbi:glycosyltransferase [Bifidobacterium xylocopae]|uniref:Glycosyl transferase family 2 n=1 Tax=Bifidobacterium xylocopae TaxID=2493119 RepID=A0A366KCP8_9BIFI|nr:glycosyltransferase family 2 protein [Bifidobacterium xylocopae]RBP99002.1 glycosyl transferase family 2 [Bifidobacterium xylocopae]